MKSYITFTTQYPAPMFSMESEWGHFDWLFKFSADRLVHTYKDEKGKYRNYYSKRRNKGTKSRNLAFFVCEYFDFSFYYFFYFSFSEFISKFEKGN